MCLYMLLEVLLLKDLCIVKRNECDSLFLLVVCVCVKGMIF